jgi:hypothetical protein
MYTHAAISLVKMHAHTHTQCAHTPPLQGPLHFFLFPMKSGSGTVLFEVFDAPFLLHLVVSSHRHLI